MLLLLIRVILPAQNIGFEDIFVAIIDFEGAGFKGNENKIITDKFRNEFIDKSNYRIMERNAMDEILKEQGFQQTGTCNSNSCFIEAGQMLGVSYLIAGRISKTNDILALSIRLIEIQTAEIITVLSYESQNDLLTLLSEDVPVIATKFIKKCDTALKELSMKKQKGLLFIESTPRNGEIFIDGQKTNKYTPVTFKEIQSGKHEIVIKSKDLISKDTIQILSGKLAKFTSQLDKGYGNLRIETSPEKIEVNIQGLGIYTSPFQVDSIEAGDYSISINVPGYEKYDGKIFVTTQGFPFTPR